MAPPLTPELIRCALESAPDAMIVADADGTILFANRQVTALFGYTPAEATALSVEALMPERFRAQHRQHREQFVRERRLRQMGIGVELLGQRKDGSEFPAEISLSSIYDRERALVAAAIRDITAHKRIETELLQARQATERAAQAKSRFLATASHDLRQPLQSLALLNGALRRMITDGDAEEALRYQEVAISTMSRLLNALLDVSKLESGAVRAQLTDTDIAPLFAELEHEFSGVAADKKLTLSVLNDGQSVHSDPALLGQILRNLLSNAIKYTPTGSVRLTCTRAREMVRIEVSDTGVGIDAAQLPHIYEEFYQVGSTGGAGHEGYGLGLSIVRRLVELLGIRLDARSTVGSGSVFTLELPPGAHGAAQPSAASGEVHLARTGSAPCVLLVEDDPAVRDATRLLLRLEGYSVRTAGSLADAVDCLGADTRIDLLITDYHLGGDDTGTEVITRARERFGADLPAVLITGDTSNAVRHLEDGRLRLASKPIRADELLNLLEALLSTPADSAQA